MFVVVGVVLLSLLPSSSFGRRSLFLQSFGREAELLDDVSTQPTVLKYLDGFINDDIGATFLKNEEDNDDDVVDDVDVAFINGVQSEDVA